MAYIEQVELRTPKETYFYDPSTKLSKVEFTLDDRRYFDGSVYRDVNEAVVADGQGKKNDTTRHAFKIGSDGSYVWQPRRDRPNEFVTVTGTEYFVLGLWIRLPAIAWKAAGAVWDTLNLSSTITNTWRGVKTEFVLKNSLAPTRFRFGIELTGLTIEGWNVLSGKEIVGQIAAPWALGGEGITAKYVPVSATYTDGYIEWNVDKSKAQFPILVDPTFTDGNGGDATTYKDAELTEIAPTTNSGTNTTHEVGSYGVGNFRHIVIGFNTASLAGKTITSANMTLRHLASGSGTMNIDAFRLLLSWTEAGVTWNTRDGSAAWNTAGAKGSGTDRAASATASVSVDTTNVDRTWDLTADVALFAAGSAVDNGWVLVPGTGLADGEFHQFSTSDYATDATLRPKLVVVYTNIFRPRKNVIMQAVNRASTY